MKVNVIVNENPSIKLTVRNLHIYEYFEADGEVYQLLCDPNKILNIMILNIRRNTIVHLDRYSDDMAVRRLKRIGSTLPGKRSIRRYLLSFLITIWVNSLSIFTIYIN